MTPLLIVHSEPENVRPVLERRLAGVPLEYASTGEAIIAKLEAVDPEVVLGIKHDDLPGPLHRPIVDHPSVRWVHVGGSGYEHIQPWDAERITVTNSAGVLAADLASTVTGAMLALNGHFKRYIQQMPTATWDRHPFGSIASKTLLVVGLGVIGECVARNAKALGMRVIATRRSAAPHPDVDEVHPSDALHDLLPQADFVSLHVRSDATTRHLIDAEALDLMKETAYLVNSSRGAVVDEAALVEALRENRIAGAYLDVFETEPLPADSPLWQLDNVLLTPHTSDNIFGWDVKFAELFADNYERWTRGEPLINRVSP